jgi:hypothetical protein
MNRHLNILLGTVLLIGAASDAAAGDDTLLHKMIFEQKSFSADYAQTV